MRAIIAVICCLQIFANFVQAEPLSLIVDYLFSQDEIEPDHLSEYLEKNLDYFLTNIKKKDEKYIIFKNLKATLGHHKKRKYLLLSETNAKLFQADEFEPHPWRHKKLRDTLKAVLILWLTEPEFVRENFDIDNLLTMLFGKHGAKSDSPKDPIKWAIYPNRSEGAFKYYPWPAIIDPEQIYRLELLYVSKGHSLKNAFGHSAILIVMCPPGEQLKERCVHRQDLQYVITFRALLPEKKPEDGLAKEEREVLEYEPLDPLKAVNGDYPSAMFFQPVADFLSGYMWKEEREVMRIPLLLNQSQQKAIVLAALRKRKDASSSYRFFSNNCATELLELFQGVVAQKKIFKIPLSPDGLIETIDKCGLCATSFHKDGYQSISKLMELEQQGLAFVPPLRQKRFLLDILQKKLESGGFTFDNDKSLSILMDKNKSGRLEFYKNIFEAMLKNNSPRRNSTTIDSLIKNVIWIEHLMGKELINDLITQASLSNDPDFMASEQAVLEKTKEVIAQINSNKGNLFMINDQVELTEWQQKIAEAQQMLTHNWECKLALPTEPNDSLKYQEKILEFLWALIPPIDDDQSL